MKPVGWRLSEVLLFLVTLAVQAAPAADVTPQSVKLVLPELDRLVEQTLKKTGVPGMAIAVVCKDQVIHLKGFGVREAGKEERVDADTVFQLASVSKPMASTVLAALVGEGFIDWDDRVIDHDPGFRLSDPFVTREVTLRDLLCHRSGLPDHAGDLLEDFGYERAEVLAGCALRNRRAAFARNSPTRTLATRKRVSLGRGRPGRPGRTSPPTSSSAPWA